MASPWHLQAPLRTEKSKAPSEGNRHMKQTLPHTSTSLQALPGTASLHASLHDHHKQITKQNALFK